MGWFKSKDPRALEAAQAAYDQDRFADAVELCNQALDRAGNLVELCLLRGKALYGLGDFQQAVTDFDYCLQHDPRCEQAYLWRANTLAALGQWSRAYEDLFHELHREELRGMSPHSQRIPGVRVQANRGLYEPGPENLPALYLISFDPKVHNNLAFLGQLADRMFDLEECNPEDATLDEVSRIGLRNQLMAEPGRRSKLPVSFTGGVEVFAVDLIVYRPYLPQGYLTKRSLMCLAEPGNEGWTEHIPETVP